MHGPENAYTTPLSRNYDVQMSFFRHLHIKLLQCKQMRHFIFGLTWGVSYKVAKNLNFELKEKV